jgi:serine dehydrogenase proteinase
MAALRRRRGGMPCRLAIFSGCFSSSPRFRRCCDSAYSRPCGCAKFLRSKASEVAGYPAGSPAGDDVVSWFSDCALRRHQRFRRRNARHDVPIDLVLHAGRTRPAALQIAKAVREHKAKDTVLVPHYAMSGGTLIALAADEIVISKNSLLGPIDPQLGNSPAASLSRLSRTSRSRKSTTGR